MALDPVTPGECQTDQPCAIVPTDDLAAAALALPTDLAPAVVALLASRELWRFTQACQRALHEVVREEIRDLFEVYQRFQLEVPAPDDDSAMSVLTALALGMVLGINDTIPADPAARAAWIQQQTAVVRLGILHASRETAGLVREIRGIHG